ncbi:hypothetical protein [Gimesia fumaroli]|uniref:Uncharacterized protein n=1 Tax=Gimesia fumaroli TaxID=2527976 RepID=A0A518IGH8_9PLAN|nr:hypothetical protein [Gimesia fumaroli]QDV52194.1 hypothetical protein Enr17x_42540 [Gimesia fumaroli]
MKKAIWVPYGGVWGYVPFCNGTINWVLDNAEIEKLKILAKVIVDARFLITFLAKSKDTLICLGISEKDIELQISKAQDLEEFAMAYGRAILEYIPQGYSNPGTVRTFDFAEYEGRKPWIKKLLQVGLEGFVIGLDVGLAEGVNMMPFGLRTAMKARRLNTPLGAFHKAADVIRKFAGKYGDDIFCQGGRAKGRLSDFDFAVRVSPKEFEEIVRKRFGNPNPGSAKFKTMQMALKRGRIHAGEAGFKSLKKELVKILGDYVDPKILKKVDISIVRRGGLFDRGPRVPILP